MVFLHDGRQNGVKISENPKKNSSTEAIAVVGVALVTTSVSTLLSQCEQNAGIE
mgnify:CR=1 FL=1